MVVSTAGGGVVGSLVVGGGGGVVGQLASSDPSLHSKGTPLQRALAGTHSTPS